MDVNAGQKITVRARPKRAVGGQIVTDAAVTANFFAPGKSPQTSPADRAAPDSAVPCPYDGPSRYYLATVDTTGWAPGTWTIQAVATGGAEALQTWGWTTFTVDA